MVFLAQNQSIAEKLLLGEDMIPFLQWWLVILILGIIFMPLSGMLFSNLSDKGYLFSKTIGIAVTGYLMWMLSAIKVMKFTTVSCIAAVGIGLILNIFIVFYYKHFYKPHGSTKYNERKNISSYLCKDNLKIFIT